MWCRDISLEEFGRKIYPSEAYLLMLRHMKKDYRMDPWEWDMDYPDDMFGKYFPEDINGLVGLDVAISNHLKVKESQNVKH